MQRHDQHILSFSHLREATQSTSANSTEHRAPSRVPGPAALQRPTQLGLIPPSTHEDFPAPRTPYGSATYEAYVHQMFDRPWVLYQQKSESRTRTHRGVKASTAYRTPHQHHATVTSDHLGIVNRVGAANCRETYSLDRDTPPVSSAAHSVGGLGLSILAVSRVYSPASLLPHASVSNLRRESPLTREGRDGDDGAKCTQQTRVERNLSYRALRRSRCLALPRAY
ncbi:hypothetical protein JHW43_007740 [Diplocarpon mali]|nr:hypothetical protein JHW43_007740 [Diplocarpon mali]